MIQNPILKGFHPDPSMIYVNGTFYIANSTFEYFPGVSISASEDLINWRRLKAPLDTTQLLDMKGNPKSGGIWAPCLTYADDYFYLVFTDVKSWSDGPFKDTPNFITKAKSIDGPWSEPVYINSSGFDPSLFHDEDGKKYIVNMEWDYREEGAAQFTGILLTEIDSITFEKVSETRKIFWGSELGLVEGPHLYKINGYYYLITAEGGTSYNHAVTVARSKQINGPYELHPNQHLVTTKDAPDAALQKTGHGSICQSADGRWWLAFLCGRHIDDTMSCILGRETGIAEIMWENDWPYLMDKTLVPSLNQRGIIEEAQLKPMDRSYQFDSEQFQADFMSLRVPAKYELLSGNTLRLFGKESLVSRNYQNMLVRRQTSFYFEAETSVCVYRESFQVMAGLLYRYDEENQYYLRVAYNEKKKDFTLGILSFDHGKFNLPLGKNEIPVGKGFVKLKITVEGTRGYYSYSLKDEEWQDILIDGSLYEIDPRKLSDEYATPYGFTGAFIGISCQDFENSKEFADFNSFVYKEFESKD